MGRKVKLLFLAFSLVCILALAACNHTHQSVSAWTADAKSHWKACEGCDELLEKADHSYGDWTIITEATTATAGLKKRVCNICAYEQEEAIPALHSHTYGDWTTVTEATCSTVGKKAHTCTECNAVEEAEIPTLPHTGEIECEVCHAPLLTGEFYNEMVTSLIQSNTSIVLSNLEMKIGGGEYVTLELAEAVFSLDENKQLFGAGTIQLTSRLEHVSEYAVPVEYTCIIQNQKLIAKAFLRDPMYISYDLCDLTLENGLTMAELLVIVEEALSIYKTKVIPMLEGMLENDMASNQLVLGFINRIFTMHKVENGYSLEFNYDIFRQLNDTLSEISVSELANMILGEGMYESITELLPIAFTLSIENILALLELNGISLEAVVSVINQILPYVIGQDVSLEDLLFAMGYLPEGVSIVELINNPEFRKLTIIEFVREYFGINATGYDKLIVNTLNKYKDYKVYGLAAEVILSYIGYTPEEGMDPAVMAKELIDQVVDFASNLVNLSIHTSETGKISKYSIGVNYSNLEGILIDAVLDFDYNYESQMDYDKVVEEVEEVFELVNPSYEKLQQIPDMTTSIDENGNIIAFRTRETKNIKTTVVDGDITTRTSSVTITRYIWTISSLNSAEIDKLCGPWYEVYLPYDSYVIETTFLTRVEQIQNDIVISTVDSIQGGSTYSAENGFVFGYNVETNEVAKYGLEHDYKYDESKSVPPTGCTDMGMDHYECAECGKVKEELVYNDHDSFYLESTELMNGSSDCYDGVILTYHCTDCDYTYTEESYGHYTVKEYLNLEEHGVCASHIFEYSHCACEYYKDLSTSNCTSMTVDNPEYDSLVVCSECNLKVYSKQTTTEIDSCVTLVETKYDFYIGDSLVKQFTIEKTVTSHDMSEHRVLLGENCIVDGWRFINECSKCDYSYYTTGIIRDHSTGSTRIDLSKYSINSSIYIYECLCGDEIGGYSISSYSSNMSEASGNNQSITQYFLSDEFIVRMTCNYTPAGLIDSLIVEIGYDSTTGACLETITY